MSNPKAAMTWQQLKEFANSLPEEKLSCPVIWWGDERGGEIQSASVLKEDFVQTDEFIESYKIFEENLGEGESMDDYDKAYMTGDPILYTDEYE